ncbi:MAG: LysM peptidoglycan-binding domain-containing protein [Anaerolineae bacterium]|nr:LysM peptidoglycan-binding domain-containing protein [Anaerolineae bacterium]
MKCKQLLALGTLLVVATALLPTLQVNATNPTVPMRQEIGVNLLANPGFEGIGVPINNSSPNYGNWTRDTFSGANYGEIYSPEGWMTWWQEGEFKRPECKVIPRENPFIGDPEHNIPSRIYDGYYSGLCFSFFGKQNAGYLQVVRNLPPNSVVEASFYAHAWSCGEDEPPLSCGDVNGFYFRVGIDPNGGTDPFSSNIVWSAAYYNRDNYGLVGPVQATVGAGGVATMFIQSYGKWALKHNDAYYDNASFKLVTQGTPPTETAAPPPPTTEYVEPTVSPFTPTPLPNGSIVHTVVEGDTLFGISLSYDVSVDELLQYNAGSLTRDGFLSIGQEIVIRPGAGGITPTATPAPVETPAVPETTPEANTPITPTTGIPAAPTQGLASLCVLAYEDTNKDMVRQSGNGEMPLPNAEIVLVGTAGPIGDPYHTDGIREPYCFENLQPGSYILRHTAPAGYTTDVGPWNIPLTANQVVNVELGYVRSSDTSPQATVEGTIQPTEARPTEETGNNEANKDKESSGGMTGILSTVLRISGIIVVVLAVAVLALFLLSRRPV